MSDFSHVAAQAVDGTRSIKYVFYELDGQPHLWVFPATRANRPYYAAQIKRLNARLSRGGRGSKITPEMLDEAVEMDKELFSKFVVDYSRGWGVTLADGSPAACDPATGQRFLEALPDDVFEPLQVFAKDVSNWREGGLSEEDLSEAAGNSEGGSSGS